MAGHADANKPTISVIIPVHNGGENFRKCLSALAEADSTPDETIVVIDGAMDSTGRLAATFGVQVLSTPNRSGPARVRNLGASAACSDILFFVDADVLIHPDAISQVAAIFMREPDLAAVFGSYDDTPAATNFLSQYKNLFHHYIHQTSNTDASTFWSGCGAIRRDVFFTLGGYDEHYPQPAIEDIEFGYRLKNAGYRIQLCKTLQVKHLKHWGVISLLEADFFYRALPWTELIWRSHQFVNDLNLRFSSRISVILVFVLLGALIGAWWCSTLVFIAGASSVLLLAFNASVYRFFLHKRGLRFVLQVIPWHWLYYLYSGFAFIIGTIWHLSKELRFPWRSSSGERAKLSYKEESQEPQ